MTDEVADDDVQSIRIRRSGFGTWLGIGLHERQQRRPGILIYCFLEDAHVRYMVPKIGAALNFRCPSMPLSQASVLARQIVLDHDLNKSVEGDRRLPTQDSTRLRR